MRKHGYSEPPKRFLETPEGQRAEVITRRLHRWLDRRAIAITAAGPDDIREFIERPFRKIVNPRTALQYKQHLIHYLAWLYERGMLDFDPKVLGIRRRRPLPLLAQTFVQSLEPTHRPSTCNHYRTTLQRFHEWLDDARIRLPRLTRPQVEQWLLSLSDRGLHPSTRIHAIQHVRSYLRWLDERGEIRRDADDIIRSSDLPKLPSYLPRPLPPEVDRELQSRLARSLNPLWQGLLLMRHTGMRIGELRALEYGCVRTDPNGNPFLKVPLGKLNSERLVPLSPQACALIRALQQGGRLKRPYLLERVDGTMVRYPELTEALRRACEGLETPEPITSHRLRHTYATSLLNAGMSLLSVMKLLGHRDYRMTLRYTAITQETVGKEYAEALARVEDKYTALKAPPPTAAFDPLKALTDVAVWIKEGLGHDPRQAKQAQSLVKRIARITETLEQATAETRKN